MIKCTYSELRTYPGKLRSTKPLTQTSLIETNKNNKVRQMKYNYVKNKAISEATGMSQRKSP